MDRRYPRITSSMRRPWWNRTWATRASTASSDDAGTAPDFTAWMAMRRFCSTEELMSVSATPR